LKNVLAEGLEATMATITVKDIPDDLYEALKKAAARHHRSINSEIIYYIEQAVRSREVNVEEVLERARHLRAEVGPVPMSQEILNEYKNTGRP
jgi:plasmid stability protein